MRQGYPTMEWRKIQRPIASTSASMTLMALRGSSIRSRLVPPRKRVRIGCVLATCAICFNTHALTLSSTHIFSSFSTSRARFLYRSFPSYFRTGISNSQYSIIVCRKHSELRNEVVPSRETGNSHHEGDNEPASRVKEQFDRRER